MKVVNIPTRIYEPGDRALTPDGMVTVILDELEDIELCFDTPIDEFEPMVNCRQGVIVRLDEGNSNHEAGEEVAMSRDNLSYKPEAR